MAAHVLSDAQLSEALHRGDYPERFLIGSISSGVGVSSLAADGVGLSALREPRGPTSVKSFCFPPRQLVATYSAATADNGGVGTVPARLVVGARACETRALRYLDRVFGAPPQPDPLYRAYRDSLVLVTVDCIQPHQNCFCNLVDGKPYADGDFDVNLTPISGGFVVEAGSPPGEAFLEHIADLLTPATAQHEAEREHVRQGAVRLLSQQNADYDLPNQPAEMPAPRPDDEQWDRLGASCVECGACTQICPTCHCFSLADHRRDGGAYERVRAWDSCLWSGYSRMAGATGMKPNPRAHFRSRFANRFLHKFVWSLEQWNLLGCVGCGRCFDACPGAIDIRRVLQTEVA
jgi:formate hydrogenlyase subunit 6/NADH:ubiquinone oxidoreductase subunit I